MKTLDFKGLLTCVFIGMLTAIVVGYFPASFVAMDFNPYHWHIAIRGGVGLLALLFILIFLHYWPESDLGK